MAENFAELFEKSQAYTKMRSGDIVKGKVVSIEKGFALVNVGLKSEGLISLSQFANGHDTPDVNIGDEVDVYVETPEDGYGETRLSREKAKRAVAWTELEKAHKAKETITGLITGKVKGGFTVEIEGVRAFLPGSLVDVRPVRDSSYLEGKDIELKVIKMDHKRNNVVVSRRAVVEEEASGDRASLLDNLAEGQSIKGIVKNLTDYGAFVDLGGIDGLLHITDMSWKRIKHPSEVVKVGDEIDVKVLKFDREKSRVSLGLKQLGDDPWVALTERYPSGSIIKGVVTNMTDYGCFIEIEKGIEGLVHMSEMDWTNKNVHPSKIVQLGDEVQVMVLEIDEVRRRISLGMKQCQENPWDAFSKQHHVGEKITGGIKSITDFGVFIGLDGNIDGLIHLSDVSADKPGEEVVRDFKKGQEIEAIILTIDPERERIALGIRQLGMDAFDLFVDGNAKGSNVKGNVIGMTDEGARVELAPDIVGDLPKAEIEGEVNLGDNIEARIADIDKETKAVSLTMKLAAKKKPKKAKAEVSSDAGKTTLGDLLKAKMSDESEEIPNSEEPNKEA